MQRQIRFASLAATLVALALVLGGHPTGATEPGDLPQPAAGVRVIDPDDRLTDAEESSLQGLASRLERETGGQLVFVVTVSQGWRPTGSAAELQARQLMDRWGVGRAGVNDGAVVLVMLDDSRCHGGAYLFLGAGAIDAWFSGEAGGVQELYDRAVDPLLRECDVAGAMRAAGNGLLLAATGMRVGQGEVSPRPAMSMSEGKVLLLIVVLMLATFVGALTIGWWWLAGRDPRVANDDSILVSAPPADLTPALAATLLARGPTDTALAAALIDSASRGQVTFFRSGETGPDQPGIGLARPPELGDPEALPVRPESVVLRGLLPQTPPRMPKAEVAFTARLDGALSAHDGRMEWWDLAELVRPRKQLLDGLEWELVQRGLLARRRSDLRLLLVPALLIGGVAAAGAWWFLANPMLSATIVVAGFVAAGPLAVLALAGAPALTLEGTRARVWLDAFRRTLARTMTDAPDLDAALRQAREMGLHWLETPDRLFAWAVALGLAQQAGALLRRTADLPAEQPWLSAVDTVAALMSIGRMGAVIANFDSSRGGGISLGGFGGGISFGGGGGGGSF